MTLMRCQLFLWNVIDEHIYIYLLYILYTTR